METSDYLVMQMDFFIWLMEIVTTMKRNYKLIQTIIDSTGVHSQSWKCSA